MKDNNSKEIQENETKTEVTRTSDTRYVVQRRKPSVFLSIILVLIGAVATAVIMLICFGDKIIPSNEENNTRVEEQAPENKEEVKEVRVLNLNPDGDFITLLYSKLMVDVRNVPQGYKEEKIEYNSLSDNDKLTFVLRRINGKYGNFDQLKNKLDAKVMPEATMEEIGRITVIEYDEAEKLYKSIYGADKNLPKIDAETHMGYVYEWVEEDNKFYGHSYNGGGGSSYNYLRKITKCEKNEDATEVYIYDKFLSFNNTRSSAQGNIWTLAKDQEQKEIIKDNILEVFAEYDSLFEGKTMETFLQENIDKNGGEYKHTFKLDDAGNYYWYSSEKAN